MGTKVLDADVLLFDAEVHGTFTIATHDSDSIDTGLADADEYNAGTLIAKWPGLDSAGSMTVGILIQDSADDSSFATIWTGPVMDKVTSQAEMADWRFALPTKSLRRYVRIQVIVGAAVASAGLLTVGWVK